MASAAAYGGLLDSDSVRVGRDSADAIGVPFL